MDPRLLPPARLARSALARHSDERLAELAGAGSEAGFETLVARHRRALVGHCTRVVGDADAEEAVQEALVRAHAALLRGDPVSRPGPWLHAIARNTALNLRRARLARPRPTSDDCACPPAEDPFAARLELREVVAAVEALPARQREAIVMRELEGRSYVEIADRIGTSPGAVRQLLNRARTSVRRRLASLLPWGSVVRWLPDGTGGGAVGSRLGALPEACAATAKVCAVVLPAAIGFGAAGVAPPRLVPKATPARAAPVVHRHVSASTEAARKSDHYGRFNGAAPVARTVTPVRAQAIVTLPGQKASAPTAAAKPKHTSAVKATHAAGAEATTPLPTPAPTLTHTPARPQTRMPAPIETQTPAPTQTATSADTPAQPEANMVQPHSPDQRGAPP